MFAALRVKRTMTPDGMLMVVKLKTPFAGSVSVVLVVGVKAPSAPLLPLLNVCASAGQRDGPDEGQGDSNVQQRTHGCLLGNSVTRS